VVAECRPATLHTRQQHTRLAHGKCRWEIGSNPTTPASTATCQMPHGTVHQSHQNKN
jgi:hypothetical protein